MFFSFPVLDIKKMACEKNHTANQADAFTPWAHHFAMSI